MLDHIVAPKHNLHLIYFIRYHNFENEIRAVLIKTWS